MNNGLLKVFIFALIIIVSNVSNKIKKDQEKAKENTEEINTKPKLKDNKTSKKQKNILDIFLDELNSEAEKPQKKSEFFEDLYKSFTSDEGKKEIIEKNLTKNKNLKKKQAKKEKTNASTIAEKDIKVLKEKEVLTADELKEEIIRERENYRKDSSDLIEKSKDDKNIDFDFKEGFNNKSLAKAIILSEIIDKPISLRDE